MPTLRWTWLLPWLVLLLAARSSDPPNRTFQRGEYLKFRLHYGLINAGYASLEVTDQPVYFNGRPCYHIVGKGWSSAPWDRVFRIRDRYESWMDQETLVPYRFERYINEGNFHTVQKVRFEQQRGRARYYDPDRGHQVYSVPPNIHDVLSAFFYARAKYDHRQLAVGDHISLRNFLDRKTFDLEAELLKRETIKIEGQRFEALKFDLLIEEAGLITDGSKIQFWISDDANKVPLRIASELMIGSLKCDLIQWEGLRHPFVAWHNG
jgi:hypothetical protein